jgi:hypothetical protein
VLSINKKELTSKLEIIVKIKLNSIGITKVVTILTLYHHVDTLMLKDLNLFPYYLNPMLPLNMTNLFLTVKPFKLLKVNLDSKIGMIPWLMLDLSLKVNMIGFKNKKLKRLKLKDLKLKLLIIKKVVKKMLKKMEN